jgi:hypothetical protein
VQPTASGNQNGVLSCILDCFGTPGDTPSPRDLRALATKLSRIVQRLQREQNRDNPFSPHLFRRTIEAAAELARLAGLIE